MDQKSMVEPFEIGAVVSPGIATRAADKPWHPIPASNGGSMKDLVTGKETGGAFSYHLMRIQRGGEIPDHAHETQWSWNAVLGGAGSFVVGGVEVPVENGQVFVTPPRVHHSVRARDGEISLLAIFVPALG